MRPKEGVDVKYAILRDMSDREDEEFNSEEDAIDFALGVLSSDDFAYGILDTEVNDFTCIVFQQREWRP